MDVFEVIAGAPRTGDSIRVRLPSGRFITRRITGHVHLRAGEVSLQVGRQTFAGASASIQVEVRGFRDLLQVHRDREGWYADAQGVPDA